MVMSITTELALGAQTPSKVSWSFRRSYLCLVFSLGKPMRAAGMTRARWPPASHQDAQVPRCRTIPNQKWSAHASHSPKLWRGIAARPGENSSNFSSLQLAPCTPVP